MNGEGYIHMANQFWTDQRIVVLQQTPMKLCAAIFVAFTYKFQTNAQNL